MTDAEKTAECSVHEDYAGQKCPGCGEEVDAYGNTAYDFRHCSFPDCGCDGERLCMAGNASDRASSGNVEGMWRCKTRAQRQAIAELMNGVYEEKPRG